jgi:hypothetical protein
MISDGEDHNEGRSYEEAAKLNKIITIGVETEKEAIPLKRKQCC